jgi:hypothetical protein
MKKIRTTIGKNGSDYMIDSFQSQKDAAGGIDLSTEL